MIKVIGSLLNLKGKQGKPKIIVNIYQNKNGYIQHMYSVPFQPCLRMEESLCFLLDQSFHGWWLHHVPHLHPGALLLLAAGAVGALCCSFVGSDSRDHHGQGQHQQQGQSHRANSCEYAGDKVSCQLEGWK